MMIGVMIESKSVALNCTTFVAHLPLCSFTFTFAGRRDHGRHCRSLTADIGRISWEEKMTTIHCQYWWSLSSPNTVYTLMMIAVSGRKLLTRDSTGKKNWFSSHHIFDDWQIRWSWWENAKWEWAYFSISIVALSGVELEGSAVVREKREKERGRKTMPVA